jgi:hypothetical protein
MEQILLLVLVDFKSFEQGIFQRAMKLKFFSQTMIPLAQKRQAFRFIMSLRDLDASLVKVHRS